MNVKEIRDLYTAAPFRPFELVLTNGTTIQIAHPEFMMFSPDYRTVHAVDARDDIAKRIDVKVIIALNELKNGVARRKQ